MSTVFVDTGYLLALEIADDQHHAQAIAHWKNFSRSLPKLVTTSYVFDEVATFFNSRGYHSKAVKIGNQLLNSPSVELVHIDRSQFDLAWQLFSKYQDKKFSFTDCLSFVVMRRRHMKTVLTFDNHFKQMGFQLEPQ